jgi:hypothetical protein
MACLLGGLVVTAVSMISVSAQNTDETIVSTHASSLPNTRTEPILIHKITDMKTAQVWIESASREVPYQQDLTDLPMCENEAISKNHGNIRGESLHVFGTLKPDDCISVVISTRMPLVKLLNKTKHRMDELNEESRLLLALKPIATPRFNRKPKAHHKENTMQTLVFIEFGLWLWGSMAQAASIEFVPSNTAFGGSVCCVAIGIDISGLVGELLCKGGK